MWRFSRWGVTALRTAVQQQHLPLRAFHSRAIAAAAARVLISDPIDKSCVDLLRSKGFEVDAKTKVPPKEELVDIIRDFDALIVRSGTKVTSDVIDAGEKLKIIGRAGVGVDNIDVAAATKKGVMVMNTPGGNTVSAAELAFSLMIALSRNVPAASASLKNGEWERKAFTGTELLGKTVGIVGLGRIGRQVAKYCQAFGMKTIGFDPVLSSEICLREKIDPVTLEEIYAESDFISLHSPLTAETKDLFNKVTFAKCKPGVRIVNAARGGIVNEVDLLEALEGGQVGGAALDVYSQEPPPKEIERLLQHPRVVCTPHLGASTEEAQEKVAVDIANQLVDALAGTRIYGVVNSPVMATLAANKALAPYVDLAERIGSMQAQLVAGHFKEVEITSRGPIFEGAIGVMEAALLKGVLSHTSADPVNLINGPTLAKSMGLKVREIIEEVGFGRFQNEVVVRVKSEDGVREVTGTTFAGEPRVTSIDGLSVDFSPVGNFVYFQNEDRPGILSSVFPLLSNGGINIIQSINARSSVLGSAQTMISLDSILPTEILHKIKEVAGLSNVRMCSLPLMDTGKDASLPQRRPMSPNFGSGPTKKRPGYSLSALPTNTLGRSHRSSLGKAVLKEAIDQTKVLLQVPEDYLVAIVPGSNTGAVEMAMWSLFGPRTVEVLHWESFGKGWLTDAAKQLKIDVIEKKADYGSISDLSSVSPKNDVIFTWNGTTSGVRVPNGDWISDNREGLTVCDATSAVFAMDMPWEKLDVTTFSFQKVLGGEGAHGVLILSPRAVERLESFQPDRPLPKLFRLTKDGKLNKSIFTGSVINTPSMLVVEDYLDALRWAKNVGGLPSLIQRSKDNFEAVEDFVNKNDWIHFLAKDKDARSTTSVCLTVDLPEDKVKKMVSLLAEEKVAYDIGAYRDAPAGLRIWCGATVDTPDVKALMPWLEWAYNKVK